MAKRRTIRVGDSPGPAASGLDPRSGEIAAFYREGETVPSDVPARDLNGGDLDRIAYNRRFRAGDGAPPGPLAEGELEALLAELVATGAFGLEHVREEVSARNAGQTDDASPAPEAAAETTTDATTEPEQPAEAPEG